MKTSIYAAVGLLLATICAEPASAQHGAGLSPEQIITEFPDYKVYTFGEHELEWNEFKEKKAFGLIIGDYFMLENRGVKPIVYTITEMPVNTAGDFIVTAVIEVNKFDKETFYTFYLNAEDIQNCTAVTFSAQSVQTLHIKDGRPGGEQRSVLNMKKGVKQIAIAVRKTNGSVTLTINGDDCIKFRKMDFANTGIGFGALPKQRIKIISVGAGSKNPDEEE